MTDLNELQFFAQVAKAHSFTMAARRLGVPKSSVSRAVRRLEGRLGVRLVERTTRNVALTEVGEVYLDAVSGCWKRLNRPIWRSVRYWLDRTGSCVSVRPRYSHDRF
jgi:DNA-binding transcriptional LysR family regulator